MIIPLLSKKHIDIFSIKKFIWLVLLPGFFLDLQSQESEKVTYVELGLTFIIPQGWKGQEYGDIYMMAHQHIPGFIFLIPHDAPYTQDQLLKEAALGMDLGNGSFLQPVGAISRHGKDKVGGEFEGSIEYTPAKSYVIAISNPHGNGLTVISTTAKDMYVSDKYRGLAEEVAANVEFSRTTAASENVTGRSELEEWKYQLGGSKLTWMESYSSGGVDGGGYNMSTEIHLCEAGYFLYYDENFMSAGNQNATLYSSGRARNQGSWEVVLNGKAPNLILTFNDGNQKTFFLEWREDTKLFLDGYRYFRTWTGENAPNCNN